MTTAARRSRRAPPRPPRHPFSDKWARQFTSTGVLAATGGSSPRVGTSRWFGRRVSGPAVTVAGRSPPGTLSTSRTAKRCAWRALKAEARSPRQVPKAPFRKAKILSVFVNRRSLLLEAAAQGVQQCAGERAPGHGGGRSGLAGRGDKSTAIPTGSGDRAPGHGGGRRKPAQAGRPEGGRPSRNVGAGRILPRRSVRLEECCQRRRKSGVSDDILEGFKWG